jgi:hypothetical protein
MNGKHTVFNWQFQDIYYRNSLPLRLDWHIGGTVRGAFAFASVGLAALLGGCVQDGLMDMARFPVEGGRYHHRASAGRGIREVVSLLR